MLRNIVAAAAALLGFQKAKAKVRSQTLTAIPEVHPAFFIPQGGSFEGAQIARRKNRRAKIIRRRSGN